ncbi:MAG: Gfo/Idh/MocA family oxidoreductase [Armatimonadetes bacterium]|nr:Gfo/Idh/MocA family oxidoreductase [Armatimonadota bacterium]
MNEIGRSAEEALEYVKTVPKRQGEMMLGVPFEPLETVRVGFIGVGGRGYGQLHEVLAVEGAQVTAISDPVAGHTARAKQAVESKGQPTPAIEEDWRRLCDREDVDFVYICSRWEDHVPHALQAMESGKHAAVEVPASTTLSDCWRLVDTSERTRRHCTMLENCCYEYAEMMIMNMIRAGLLGTITHGEAAYIHDLRSTLLADESEGLWRRDPHIWRNANLYPTHGLGPIARYMDIHRGDRFTRLVSMSSLSASLAEYRDATLPADNPKRQEVYRCGDMNLALMQTALGRTVVLQHDVVTPRPYSRINLIQGTKGTFCDYPPRIFLDGQREHDWVPLDAFRKEYEHDLWRQQGELARKLGGHGGMDFIMNYRLIQCIREGVSPEMDVYDAAAWSAPTALSEISVAWDNMPLPFPDFTRGGWQG